MAVLLIPFPNSITADQDKVIVLAELDCLDVGMASDSLAVVLQASVFLIVEIAQAPRKVQVVVNASSFNFVTRRYYPLQLQRVLRLVVLRKLNNLSFAAEGCPRIARVGHVEGPSHQQAHVGSAAH